MQGETEGEKTRGADKNPAEREGTEGQTKGEEEAKKRMRTLLKDFMTDINKEQQEQGEVLRAPSTGANRAEEQRMRRLQKERREEERKRREEEEETRKKKARKKERRKN